MGHPKGDPSVYIMKIFISYRYTGEDLSVLRGILVKITSLFENKGHSVFCSFGHNDFFQKENYSYKQILDYALKELDESDYVFAFVKSQEKSEGMLLELGYAYAKGKKIILAKKEDVHTTFVQEMAKKTISFVDLEDLYKKLELLELP